MSILRRPPLHFLALGALLFGCSWFVRSRAGGPQQGQRETIEIGAARAAALRAEFVARVHAQPTAAQYAALLQDAVDEEILVREARRLKLEDGDPSVRLRLIHKMRTLGTRPGASDDDLVAQALALGLDDDVIIRRLLAEKASLVLSASGQKEAVSEAEVAAYFKAHQAALESPPAVDLHHVFVPGRDEHARSRAVQLLARLRAQRAAPEQAEEWSAPFPSGLHSRALSHERLARELGPGFAKAVASLPSGQWVGPVESPFGYHLVWWSEAAANPGSILEALRPTIVGEIAAARARERYLGALEALRRLYPVRTQTLSASVGP